MVSRIRILPEQLCNKIAAGEVVERPASVLKELLENSLDARSTDIRVEVEKGGKSLIRVLDDGEGMGREDVFLCLERHATSKIRCDEDLFRLHTLGFRGEALPSIASVSRFLLKSCPEESLEGWEIYAEGGIVRRSGVAGLRRGTHVEVRDLFFNTPARKKFLKRDETELGHLADIVTRLALARPEVHFCLAHNGRTLLEVPRQGGLKERVASLLGRPLARDLLSLEKEGGQGLRLTGLIARPEVNRSSTASLYTFINGRYIRDRVVQHAILEGYRHLLEKGRYPITVLFLEIDPALVDVNVHPTKHEVRFREQGMIHDFIAASVRDTLRPAGWLSRPGAAGTDREAANPGVSPPEGQLPLRAAEEAAPVSATHRERVKEALQGYSRRESAFSPAGPAPFPNRPAASAEESPPPAPAIEPFRLPAVEPSAPGGFFSSLRVIGQYRSSYILAQDGDDLLLIDQHAAHERIGFERLKQQLKGEGIERQLLLFPTVLELDFREVASVEENLSRFDRLGFELEAFGGKSYALKTIPRLLDGADPERLLRDVAEELTSLGRSTRLEEAIDQVLIRMACHGMIRANQSLTSSQIAVLLRDLDGVDFRGHCPHGRPVMKRLGLPEVERMFHRS